MHCRAAALGLPRHLAVRLQTDTVFAVPYSHWTSDPWILKVFRIQAGSWSMNNFQSCYFLFSLVQVHYSGRDKRIKVRSPENESIWPKIKCLINFTEVCIIHKRTIPVSCLKYADVMVYVQFESILCPLQKAQDVIFGRSTPISQTFKATYYVLVMFGYSIVQWYIENVQILLYSIIISPTKGAYSLTEGTN